MTCSHHFWGTLLFSDTVKYSRLMLSFPYSNPEISCSSKEPWFILAGNSIKKLSLGTKCTYCYRGFIASRTSQSTELGSGEYVCVYVHTYMYVHPHTQCHMHTCRFFCTCLSRIKTMICYSCLQFQSSTTNCISVLPFPDL